MTAAAAGGGPPAAGDPGGSQPAAGAGGPGAGGAPKPPAPGAGQEPKKDGQDGSPQARTAEAGEGGAETPPPPQSGPGAESYEATGQLGQGSQRRGLLQNAVANVEGDMVGGDKYVLVLGGQRRRLRKLSPLVAERIRFAYCTPADLPDARDALTRQRLLILRSAAGYGKSAMAVRLLLGACRGAVYHLDSGVDFASLAEQLENDSGTIERGVGFLLERPEDIGKLGRETYEKVQGALSQADAWMVVTVAAGELADGELLSGVRDLTDAPQPMEVVRSHLRWRLGERDADRLLAREELHEVITELVGGLPACRQAGDLAAAMIEQYDLLGGVDVKKLREHRARLEAEDFEIWAESLPDAGARSFALALAVLNGLPQEDVAQAARSLRERLEDDGPYLRAPGPDGRPVRSKDLFDTPRRRQLQHLRAHEQPKPGGEPGTTLEYKDPGYARRMILHAWTQYEIQGELLDWLSELVVHPAEQVRVYAAASGLGVLAAEAYRHIERRVLGPWARSDSALRRTAVAYALSVACQNPWVREQATTLVGGWYADERVQVRAAAARVHGLGAVRGRPVEELARLFVVDSVTVAVAVGCALADLVADDPDAAGQVLPMLRDRTGDHRSGRAAVLAFLIVAAQVVVETKDVEPGAAVPEWPTLLFLAHRRPELRDAFVWLWRAALNESFFHDEAEQVVGDWAKLAERDSELREMLRLLIGAIAHGDQRSGRILRSCADDWAHPDRIVTLPRTAAMVHAQLDLEGA
ncbi:hypothetical protein [Streptomyces sp. Je 1-369]|uniref:hypothetical protein n=1 Tax=Streptomyces sp. Je 1-369 TaxID=2966192 RepID=UPI0022868CD5|nr:hypothetical protein [Streptomyces sp. Je 1-369]WAL98664.1 hypothetical protein NOO62_31795 [Streptomyces sp. Je 1-369]